MEAIVLEMELTLSQMKKLSGFSENDLDAAPALLGDFLLWKEKIEERRKRRKERSTSIASEEAGTELGMAG